MRLTQGITISVLSLSLAGTDKKVNILNIQNALDLILSELSLTVEGNAFTFESFQTHTESYFLEF